MTVRAYHRSDTVPLERCGTARWRFGSPSAWPGRDTGVRAGAVVERGGLQQRAASELGDDSAAGAGGVLIPGAMFGLRNFNNLQLGLTMNGSGINTLLG